MDLKDLDVKRFANEGAKMPIRHPATGEEITSGAGKEKKAWFLRLLGSDSDTYRNAIKRRFESRRGKNTKKIDLDEAEVDAARLLAKCTTDCYLVLNGEVVKPDVDILTKIYLQYPWLKEQAEEFMGDRANLLQS